MLTLYRFGEAWAMPCVSPFVSKVAYFLEAHQVPFAFATQNPLTLPHDSPNKKLPYIITDIGQKVAESDAIMRLAQPAAFNETFSQKELSHLHRIQFLLEEHIFWHSVIYPRWVDDVQWQNYRTFFFGKHLSAEQLPISERVREHMKAQLAKSPIGAINANTIDAQALNDADELASHLQDFSIETLKRYTPINAVLTAFLRHCLAVPFSTPLQRAVQQRTHIGAIFSPWLKD